MLNVLPQGVGEGVNPSLPSLYSLFVIYINTIDVGHQDIVFELFVNNKSLVHCSVAINPSDVNCIMTRIERNSPIIWFFILIELFFIAIKCGYCNYDNNEPNSRL